jgi:hypothetical protein
VIPEDVIPDRDWDAWLSDACDHLRGLAGARRLLAATAKERSA